MGLLISINGVDFKPYQNVVTPAPLVNEARASQKVQPVQRDLDHPEQPIEEEGHRGSHQDLKAYEQAQNKTTRSSQAFYAKELMTSPVFTLGKDESVSTALSLLRKHQIRHIPIVDSDQKIIGIVSDRKIVFEKDKTLISEIMSSEIIVGQPTTRLQEIAKAMADNKISSIPIVDEDRHAVGIITASDVLESVFKNPNVNLWV